MMHPEHRHAGGPIDRRTFLVAGGLGFCGLQLPGDARAGEAPAPRRRPPARSTILVWLSGGASHIDTWDMKPEAPAEFRGEFRPIATAAPGLHLCEHLPRVARQARHLAVVRSLGHNGRGTGDHHAGYYYNLTGHAPDPSFRALRNDRAPRPSDWPFIGSVVAARRPSHPYLPQLVTLPQKPGAPRYTRPGQFAARLGLEFDPVYVEGSPERPTPFAVPALALQGDVDAARLGARRALLEAVDGAVRRFDHTLSAANYSRQQERAFALLAAPQSKAAFDVGREPESIRARYGATVNGMSLLLARRLVEAGVPFVSVFWKEDLKLDSLCKSAGGWDTHGNNFVCLREHLLPEFDRCFSALIADLHARGLLDQTLVLINSEMGRNPRVGDVRSGGVRGAGRDHWTECMSVLFAGAGVRGGRAYGSSDRVAAYPAEHPVGPEDVAATIYHAMGVDDLSFVDREGRPIDLMPEGRPILDLFGRMMLAAPAAASGRRQPAVSRWRSRPGKKPGADVPRSPQTHRPRPKGNRATGRPGPILPRKHRRPTPGERAGRRCRNREEAGMRISTQPHPSGRPRGFQEVPFGFPRRCRGLSPRPPAAAEPQPSASQPRRMAWPTMPARLSRPSFSMARALWVSTVLTLTSSWPAISRLVKPRATRRRTSSSRSLSASAGGEPGGAGRPIRPPRTLPARLGSR